MTLLSSIEGDRTFENEKDIAKRYAYLYPYGVPLRIDDPKNSSVSQGKVAWFRWRKWLYRVVEDKNYVQYLDSTGFVRWFNLTDPRNLYRDPSKKFFGVPALAAACLFLRDGTSRVCPVCNKKHSAQIKFDRTTANYELKFNVGSIVEWRGENYE